jgi:hypothetical protein
MKYIVTIVHEIELPDDELERVLIAEPYCTDQADLDQYKEEPGKLACDVAYDYIASGDNYQLIRQESISFQKKVDAS